MYNAVDVASYIVGRCANLGRPVTNLQLQKILYYVQLNFLRRFDECAFWDDIQALRHGPAVKEVYYKYNIWGRNEIVPRAVQSAKEGRVDGPTAWDGYVGQVTAKAASKARDTQTVVKIEMEEKPEFYK